MKTIAIKCITFCLCIVLLTSAVFLTASAYEYEGDKYLPDFIIDITNGDDYSLTSINDFDRYERAYEEANHVLGANYKVAFQAGGADHTHQDICASALRVLANDKGN